MTYDNSLFFERKTLRSEESTKSKFIIQRSCNFFVDVQDGIYLKFTFDFTDAANQVIRELGVMVGTKVKEAGQRYFEPQDIENFGVLLILEHTVPLIRTAATRETFSFVVTF